MTTAYCPGRVLSRSQPTRRAVALEQPAIDERHHPGQAFADGAPNEKVARAQLGVDQVARSAEQGDLGVEP